MIIYICIYIYIYILYRYVLAYIHIYIYTINTVPGLRGVRGAATVTVIVNICC